MLSEEALIVLVALGACGLLALGVAELLWPTRRLPPPPRARPSTADVVAASAPAPAIEPANLGEPAATRPPGDVAAPSTVARRRARVHRTNALSRHGLESGRRPYGRRAAPAPAVTRTAASTETAPAPREESVVERCFALHQDGRHTEAVTLAAAAMEGADGDVRPSDPQAVAALWSVVARARQALGQPAEARAALESAVAAAPIADRTTYQRQLAILAEGVARGFLAEASRHPRLESEARLVAIGRATIWAECATTAMPADPALADLAAGAQAMLWPAYERTVVALVRRQDFRAARRLLREALADPRFPTERLEAFRALFSTTFSGEIGQLTAQAMRSVQEGRETDALAALRRVESLLQTLSDEALSPERREEVDRRLAWGYVKLGERRLSTGEHEEALEPLFRALAYEVDPERRQESHALLVRALEGVTDSRAIDVRALARAGDHEAARSHCDALRALLHGATDRGVAPGDVAASFAKVQRLFESLER
jgi:tetratricopeptide (TPR) repeat protein